MQALAHHRKEHYLLSRGTAGFKFKLLTQGAKPKFPLALQVEMVAGYAHETVCGTQEDLDAVARKLHNGFVRSVVFQTAPNHRIRIDVRG